jgi:hypothetical protein
VPSVAFLLGYFSIEGRKISFKCPLSLLNHRLRFGVAKSFFPTGMENREMLAFQSPKSNIGFFAFGSFEARFALTHLLRFAALCRHAIFPKHFQARPSTKGRRKLHNLAKPRKECRNDGTHSADQQSWLVRFEITRALNALPTQL